MGIPIYMINLDRRPDRWKAAIRELGRLGLAPIRIAAIDAEAVSDRELQERVAFDSQYQWLRRGSKANILSHCRAWDALLASSHQAALIVEDDAQFASDVSTMLDTVAWWPNGAGLMKLEAAGAKRRYLGAERGRTPTGRRLYPLFRFAGGSAGYLIDRRSAEIALDLCVDVDVSIDRFLFDRSASRAARLLKPLQVVPTIIRQRHEEFASDIQATERAVRPRNLLHIGRSRFRRLGVALHKLTQTMIWAIDGGRRLWVEFSDRCPHSSQ